MPVSLPVDRQILRHRYVWLDHWRQLASWGNIEKVIRSFLTLNQELADGEMVNKLELIYRRIILEICRWIYFNWYEEYLEVELKWQSTELPKNQQVILLGKELKYFTKYLMETQEFADCE